MSRKKELFRNTCILSVGKFSTQLMSFILVPIFTFFLSAPEYGYVDLVQNYIMLVIPISILRLDAGIFRCLLDARNNSKKQKTIITNTLSIVAFQVVLLLFLFLIIAIILNINLSICIAVDAIAIAFSSVFLQAARGLGLNKEFSIGSIMAGIATMVSSIFLVCIIKIGGAGVLLGSAIGNIICSIYLIFTIRINKLTSKTSIEKNEIKKLLKYSIPMVPDELSWWILGVSDRTIISVIIGTAANGIYVVSSKFSNILSCVFQVFNMSWQENASLHINDDDKNEYFSGVLNDTYRIFYTICLTILGVMPFIFSTIISSDYRESYNYVPLLLLGNLANALSNIIGAIYIAKKNTKAAAKTTMATAVINIVINLAFVKVIGLYAAALSTLISYSLLAIYRYYDIRKYVKMCIDIKFLLMSILLFIVCCIFYIQNNILLSIINLSIIVVVSIIINKNSIEKIMRIIFEKRSKQEEGRKNDK